MKQSNSTNARAQGAEISALRAVNNLLLSENNASIDRRNPVWTASSSTPVAFQIDKQGTTQFEVEFSSIPDSTDSGTLQGLSTSGDILFSGAMDDNLVVRVQSVVAPSSFAKLPNNSIRWQIVYPDTTSVEICTTELELYWIGTDQSPATLHRKGMPIEGIRLMSAAGKGREAKLTESARTETAAISAAQILTDAFNYVPPRYDIWYGAAHFITWTSWNNITLHWTAFVNAHNYDPNSILNCYDAASVAQYWLGYNGYATSFCFMQPFGYLARTNLIGRGDCNNPFYGNSPELKVINETDPRRTAFGNHAFVRLSNNGIGDSCAGPHTGNEYIAQYVASATDSVYPNPPSVRRGTVNDVGYYIGVTHVDTITSVKAVQETAPINEFKSMVNYSEPALRSASGTSIVGKWPHPSESGVLSKDWKTYHEEIVPGSDEVLEMWMLKGETGTMSVKLFVSSGGKELVHNRFLSMGTLHQSVDNPYESVSDELGEYAVIMRNEAYSRCLVVFHNSFLEITSYDVNTDALELAKYYYNWSKENEVENIGEYLPKTDINYVKADDHIQVSLLTEDNTKLEFEDDEGVHKLMSMEEKEMIFERLDEPAPLKILVIDKDTLLVNSTDS